MEFDAKTNYRKARLSEMTVAQLASLAKTLSIPFRYYSPEQKEMFRDLEVELKKRGVKV